MFVAELLEKLFLPLNRKLVKGVEFFLIYPLKVGLLCSLTQNSLLSAEQAIDTNGLQEQRSKNDLQPSSLGFSLVPCFVLPSPTPSGPRTISRTVDTHPLPSTPALALERAT